VILHRDERCVVVDKPAGVVIHASDFVGDTDGVPLLQQVRNLVGQHVYPVHRLDRGASGIVLFALDREAAGAFSAAWPQADKRYFAITRGHPPPHTLLEHPVPRAPGEERVDATTEI
jgi:tRNA pseudouridine65 synthase